VRDREIRQMHIDGPGLFIRYADTARRDRLDESDQVDMVLGGGTQDRRAVADEISPLPTSPGGRSPDGRQDLHHAGRHGLLPLAVHHPHLPVLQARQERRHEVRHGYATAGRNAKIDVAFTMKQYVQADLDADREVANTLAALILGELLDTDEIIGDGSEADPDDGQPG
jgi:hypothetical protein